MYCLLKDMSRIGKKPILIPAGVTVTVDKGVAKVKGAKGELSYEFRPEIAVKVEGDKVVCSLVAAESKESKAFWGLARALLNNMIIGVTAGFERKLELIGVGYRAKAITGGVSLTVGYSHPVEFMSPKGIEILVPDNTNISIRGADKHIVGQVAANIRKIRKPEPYKGKGIKYAGEHIRRKAGKSAKTK